MKLRSQENTYLDLEAYIMKAWQTSEDLDALMHAELDEDEQANALLGIYTLNEVRMKDLWRVFEQFVQEKKNNS
tara:strand:- start:1433 stop:1654 length:222 start_codon:yes stop_codon:yes gene_type:complete